MTRMQIKGKRSHAFAGQKNGDYMNIMVFRKKNHVTILSSENDISRLSSLTFDPEI